MTKSLTWKDSGEQHISSPDWVRKTKQAFIFITYHDDKDSDKNSHEISEEV